MSTILHCMQWNLCVFYLLLEYFLSSSKLSIVDDEDFTTYGDEQIKSIPLTSFTCHNCCLSMFMGII